VRLRHTLSRQADGSIVLRVTQDLRYGDLVAVVFCE
jgi:hypothetical protein